jgi:protein SCO1/2
MRRKLLAGTTLLAALWLAAAMPTAAQNRWGADYFPNVTLTTQDGATVHFYDDLIKGKIVAINLIYTSCKYSCPLETARLRQVQTLLGDRMGKDVFFYSITIDPEHDTPAVMKDYSEKFHAGPGWLFLTGKQADIDLISRKIGLYSPPDPKNPDGHLPNLLVGNEATGQWMRNSGVDNPKFLARTIGDWLNSWQGPQKTLKSYADAPKMTLDRGEYTFRNHCGACHTVGQGAGIGPDLLGVTKTRERGWLTRFILTPEKVIDEGDPIARELLAKYKQIRMPNLSLTTEDAAVIIGYLDKQAAAAPASTTAVKPMVAPPRVAAGDLMAVVTPYLRIQRKLNKGVFAGVKDEARAVAEAAAKLGSAGEPMRSAAGAFARAANIKDGRTAFGTLSSAILTYAKASGRLPNDTLKVAYCPMVRKYWLQEGTVVQNPYFGPAMSECGRIVQGLAAVTN